MQYIDISPVIRSGSPVFPGDQPFEQQFSLNWPEGSHLSLSWIKSTVHIGAHADAPYHYHPAGSTIEERDLSFYMGLCQVLDLAHVGPRRILPEDIDLSSIKAPRVLFRTLSFQHDQAFQEAFSSLSPELISALAARDVRLLGIDTPSIDPAKDQDLASHQAIYREDMAVLEGLDLNKVSEGLYELIALPLRIAGADASPVRAILLPLRK